MRNDTIVRHRWFGAFSALMMLAACSSGQPTPKSTADTDSTQSSAKTDKATAAGTTEPQKTEVAAGAPTKNGTAASGADDKPYQLTLFEIERPPFAYTLKNSVIVDASPAPTLKKVSEKRNKITDDTEWFEKNSLSLAGRKPKMGPSYPAPPVPGLETMGSDKLHYLLDHGDHSILMYGANFTAMTTLLLLDKSHIARGQFDFSAWVKPLESLPGKEQFTQMEVLWAQKVGDTLYVSTASHSFAKYSKGKNAFISAIDANTGTLQWQSDPLVCNSTDFVVYGAYIICSYGFTEEPDFLYVISRADGKTVSKTPLKSGASYLVLKGNKLFVRTYDTDYVFDVK